MIYTEEEIKMLKNNTKQIEAYLRNLMPQFRDTVTVDFTGYKLRVGKTCLCGNLGDLMYEFSEEDADSSHAVSVYSYEFGTNFMAALVRNWKDIKQKLLDRLEWQKLEIKNIMEFQL